MKPQTNVETVTISVEEYDRLLECEYKLIALEGAGVDNWEGYDDAMATLSKLKSYKLK
jgi:hypothetical protein